MQSMPWKEALKHQTNMSPSKSTFAFSKDTRFKNNHAPLYLSVYPDATHSTTSPRSWAGLPPQAWARETRPPSSTPPSATPLPSTTTSSPPSKLKTRE